MRQLPLLCLLVSALFGAFVSGQAPRRDIESVAAFARLYGVVRYFYPSDAAATLDWNRFAVLGVQRVRAASDAKALEMALTSLVSPLGPGIEIGQRLPLPPAAGQPDGSLIAWRYLGAGMDGSSPTGPYRGKRTNRSIAAAAGTNGFATLMQTVPALNLRGKTVRLRGLVRATATDGAGAAALWLRVDRADRQTGFFENMSNRPIREPEWREYTIEGTIAADATSLAFGAMASGAVTADFEAISLAVRDAGGEWIPVTIKDASFEGAADAGTEGWSRAGTSKMAEITRPAGQAPEGRQFLRVSSSPGPVSTAEIFESTPTVSDHIDVDLGAGLKARVPLALSETQAVENASRASALAGLRAAIVGIPSPADLPDTDTRVADVVVAWNVFRHFYPYWTESGVDWDARLRPLVTLAYEAATRDGHRDVLRQLVADLGDGHGGVVDPRGGGGRAMLPLQFGLIDGQLVVTATATAASAEVPVGAVVSAIDGVPAAQRLAQAMRLASGATQWKQVRALQEITTCPSGAVVSLVIDTGSGPNPSSLPCNTRQPAAEKRPAAVEELTSGVWYVDLSRASMKEIAPVLPQLARATGTVFDVRGYPTDAGAKILPYLLDTSEQDRWMHVNKIVGPFGQSAGWQSFGWNLQPASPRVAGKLVFLTDGRAISYAESVMGYVADRKLATIVGGTTAGANGNVAAFGVPGGFRITFTGMRVTGHDGRTPHHLTGVKPDIAVAPTVAGLREGRDEVLDRAVALIQAK